MRYLTFGFYTALGIAGWCTLSLSLGYYFGRNWQHLIAIFTEIGYYAIAAFVVVFLAAVGYLLYARRRKIKEEVR
jgi:membrane protein DedA with SNARE-associated domain